MEKLTSLTTVINIVHLKLLKETENKLGGKMLNQYLNA